MKLSNKAIQDLKNILQDKYGVAFVNSITDEGLNNVGMLILTIMIEKIKLEEV